LAVLVVWRVIKPVRPVRPVMPVIPVITEDRESSEPLRFRTLLIFFLTFFTGGGGASLNSFRDMKSKASGSLSLSKNMTLSLILRLVAQVTSSP